MGVNHFVMLGISTVAGEFNFYSQLLNLKSTNGHQLFKVLQISLSCDDCLRKGRQLNCVHKMHQMPPWKGLGRQKLLEYIMASDPTMFQRENMGIIASDNVFLFKKVWIDWLFAKERYSPLYKPGIVYIAIDPSGGGSQSDWAICSGFHFQGAYTVCFSLLIPCCEQRVHCQMACGLVAMV